jgi:hypothetical protein
MKRVPIKFIYPVILVMCLDFLFTMIGQPANYWTDFSKVNEGSPLGFNLLKINPIYFLIFCLLYLFAMVVLIKKLPFKIGAILALSLFLGHSYGSSSWVYYLFQKMGFETSMFSHWYLTIGYLAIISMISVFLVVGKNNPKE